MLGTYTQISIQQLVSVQVGMKLATLFSGIFQYNSLCRFKRTLSKSCWCFYKFQYNSLCRFKSVVTFAAYLSYPISIQQLVSVQGEHMLYLMTAHINFNTTACVGSSNEWDDIGYWTTLFQYNSLCRFKFDTCRSDRGSHYFNTTACVGSSRPVRLRCKSLLGFQYNSLCRFKLVIFLSLRSFWPISIQQLVSVQAVAVQA